VTIQGRFGCPYGGAKLRSQIKTKSSLGVHVRKSFPREQIWYVDA